MVLAHSTNYAPNMGRRSAAPGPAVSMTFLTDTKVSDDTLVHLFGSNPSDVIALYRRSQSMRAWSNCPTANREGAFGLIASCRRFIRKRIVEGTRHQVEVVKILREI
jgi:hypothetical protein